MKMMRNDTSFPARSTARLRALHARYLAALADGADPEHAWARALKYYQYLVRAVYTDPEYGIGDGNARGLLIYATMGLGKTRLAAAVALSMVGARPVVVLLARSLQRNFRETLNALAGMVLAPPAAPSAASPASPPAPPKAPEVRYASMDAYNAAAQLGSLDGKLLIVDEAHNFFRAIINSAAERSNARRMYDTIMAARNLRIVFLSGTPASKDPFELVPCFNMLAGTDLLPTQYETFYELYVDRASHAVRNRERLANRLVGLVSHVSTARPTEPAAERGAAGPQPRDDGWFPEARPTVVERVPMAEHQYRQYMLARIKESAEGRGGKGAPDSGAVRAGPPLALPGSEQKAARSYFVRSRALSIFAAGEAAGAAGEAPKLELIARRAAAAPGPVLVYSQFIESGLKPLAGILRRAGFVEAPLTAPPTAPLTAPLTAPPTMRAAMRALTGCDNSLTILANPEVQLIPSTQMKVSDFDWFINSAMGLSIATICVDFLENEGVGYQSWQVLVSRAPPERPRTYALTAISMILVVYAAITGVENISVKFIPRDLWLELLRRKCSSKSGGGVADFDASHVHPASIGDRQLKADRQPADRQPADRQPADRQPADRQPADRQPTKADRQPADRQLADRQPTKADRQPKAKAFEPLGAADRKIIQTVIPNLQYTDAEAAEVQRVAGRERAFAPADAWYDADAAPPFEYRGGKSTAIGRCHSVAKLTNLHHGQRKLFVGELQCLTHFCDDARAKLVVVYAGAAPGHHIPFFLRLFPNIEWHLYDPRAFDVPAGPNVHLYNEYFTDAVAESWRGRADVFVSDIRLDAPTGASGWSPEFEAQVTSDMKMQDDWTRLMRPRRGAMLKFRPPYLEAGAAARPMYTHGRVLWQTWPSSSSTEGRLIVDAADAVAPRRPFDVARYQSACAVHNIAVRPWATYAPPAAGLDAVPGYDRCFDCTNEAAAWVAYRALAHASRDSAAELMMRLTAATRQRLNMAGIEKKEHNYKLAMWHGLNAHMPAPRRVVSILRAACGFTGGNDKSDKGESDKGESDKGESDKGESDKGEKAAPRFAIISGEISQESRDAIVAAFNSPANAHGAVIKAILVSKTGAEGLDLKYIRETHQVEPYWDRARDDQVKARAVRLGSHDGLPRDERVVQPYLYIAVANQKIWGDMPVRDREPHSIDEIFYDRAADRFTVNAAFRQLLAEVSLECGLFGYGDCRVCVPTGAPLFHADYALDVRLPDPCELCRESDVQATPIVLDGVTYFYVEDPAAALGYTFYTHSAALGGYAAVDPADPAVVRLLAAISREAPPAGGPARDIMGEGGNESLGEPEDANEDGQSDERLRGGADDPGGDGDDKVDDGARDIMVVVRERDRAGERERKDDRVRCAHSFIKSYNHRSIN